MSIQPSKTTADNVPVWTMVSAVLTTAEKPCRFAVISTLAAIYAAGKSTVRIPSSRTQLIFWSPGAVPYSPTLLSK